VSQPELRIKEAKKMGFSRCLLSRSNLEGVRPPGDMTLVGVESLKELYENLFENS
jgi:DNA repair protein RadA/Sms